MCTDAPQPSSMSRPWLLSTPFGAFVVPEVKMIIRRSVDSTATCGSSIDTVASCSSSRNHPGAGSAAVASATSTVTRAVGSASSALRSCSA